MSNKILVIDDDNALREMVGIVLESEGFEVSYHDAGSGALDKFKSSQPDLVLLDVMLPGKDGIEVCREIRAVSGTPIIMLTAKTESDDVVRGLEAGADDYVVKPFDPGVLTARIRARLRPLGGNSEDTVTIGPLTLDVVGHEVRRGSEKLSLTPLEFNLLLTLANKPKQVFTREMLLETVWGYHYKADTRLVNVHVQRLRSKIEDDPDNPKIVTTVRGIGYKAGQA
jgi:two-component system response regulator MtrA